MAQYELSSMQESNDEQFSQNISDSQQSNQTIHDCTMNPCPMKEKNEGEHLTKCPKCGMTEKV